VTAHSVVFTQQAARELEAIAEWWAEHRSIQQAGRWYEGFSAKIEALCDDPNRLPLADESPDFPYELRELHFGLGSRPTHRAVYTIVSEFVVVLTIRHVAQRPIGPEDVETTSKRPP
jgi:plasmid stabilization system protein ParE